MFLGECHDWISWTSNGWTMPFIAGLFELRRMMFMKRLLETYIKGHSVRGQLIREFAKTTLLIFLTCVGFLLRGTL
jgi:hypothetical protein